MQKKNIKKEENGMKNSYLNELKKTKEKKRDC